MVNRDSSSAVEQKPQVMPAKRAPPPSPSVPHPTANAIGNQGPLINRLCASLMVTCSDGGCLVADCQKQDHQCLGLYTDIVILGLWASRYNSWLLSKLMPRGVVFSSHLFPFLFFPFLFFFFPFFSFFFLFFSFLLFSFQFNSFLVILAMCEAGAAGCQQVACLR